ncbi:MAG TPA: Asp-tRNA(Asn)/Glu-tRNA(Gln) amidotransferase subunit GatB [Trueperaceae bacterium]|nr:Asp-tRNA(Asn)/Glu-tRNA(Gln) amidotransferase subunit GatB [Trueperaceae bacterium]
MEGPVVGLEVHLALRTQTKLFCGCALGDVDVAPNEAVCPVCLGLPGTLPALNEEALDLAVTFALALGADVAPAAVFDRKHYFYPDSPKNYQISQHSSPVGRGGSVLLPSGKTVRIAHCHLEEDAGRLVHPPYADHSLVDLDRAGTPLIELVTEPDIASPEEAREFLEEVQAIARASGVSDAAPEEGKLRADVNVSVRGERGELGTKVEVKNLNSFRSVQTAISFEAKRQRQVLEEGKPVRQETRGFNEGGQRTYTLRVKEGTEDYRYLPDPDIPAVSLSDRRARIAASMPELPAARASRYRELGLRDEGARIIAYDVDMAALFDEALSHAPEHAQALANWLTAEVVGLLAADGRSLSGTRIPAGGLAKLVEMVEDGRLSGRAAKELLPEVITGSDPQELVSARGLEQVSDESALLAVVDDVLAANPQLVERVKVNPKALNALLGEVMRATRGTAKADVVRSLLERRLDA